ncbi:S9 family peptidase [Candidatus Poriferisocius sp.]|uniref:S9 family peptidase n=1 Tax=Candidatus Poriferisocius sp. TaxID=3101276 RepID=UPI003B0248A0
MSDFQDLPCGSWPSPISASLIATGTALLNNLWSHRGRMWWTESRPAESGRNALVCDGEDIWDSVSVRTRVHSYGGGAWWPDGKGGVYACDDADGRLWHLTAGGEARPVSPEPAVAHSRRYADGRADGTTTVCVLEEHQSEDQARNEAVNRIVRFDGSGSSELEIVATGADFYAWPRPSPDGRRLAWIQWDHPNMPWDQTELWVDGRRVIAGIGSVVEPQWGPDGRLYVVSDHNGWWNLYHLDGEQLLDGDQSLDGDQMVPVFEMDAEMHRPAWLFDDPSYAVCDDGTVVVSAIRGSLAELWLMPAGGAHPERLDLPWTSYGCVRLDLPWTSYGCVRPAGPGSVTAIAASPTHEPTAVRIDVSTATFEVVGSTTRDGVDPSCSSAARDGVDPAHSSATRIGVDPAYLSEPRPIGFATTDGAEAHGLYYPPANPVAGVPAGERPPLLVLSHGGPTGAARSGLQLGIQYWTSRGIAVVDVNYRGSTGYGTAYREALRGRWGIVDVDDCVAAARYLVNSGEVDGDRLIIRGGSAGGYTTLSALAFHKVFAAGASRYGIADLAALAIDTHKFESRYLDSLVGPYPEAAEVYRARSPLFHVDNFDAPMIVLQGSDDEVVPPNQAEMIVTALEQRSIPVAYLLFEGEQHGFRQAGNMVAALEAELSFFAQILGFTPADDIPPVTIRR